MTDICFDDWAQEVGEQEALQFARRSSRVDKFRLVTDKKDEDAIRVQQRSGETKITFFYTFVNTLIRDRRVQICIPEFNNHSQEKEISMWISLISVPIRKSTAGGYIVNFFVKNCPHIQSIYVYTTSTAVFKIVQVNEDDDYFCRSSDKRPTPGDSNALLKVNMVHIDLTRDALDQLSRCLPNIRLLITLKWWDSTLNQQQVDYNTRSSSLNLVELKKLRKFALDINHFVPSDNKVSHLFVQLVYGQDDNKEEAYYQLVIKDRHRDCSFSPTTKKIINQQKGNTNSHLVTMHLYERPEEFVVTDLDYNSFSTTIYAGIAGGELKQNLEGLKSSHWFGYF